MRAGRAVGGAGRPVKNLASPVSLAAVTLAALIVGAAGQADPLAPWPLRGGGVNHQGCSSSIGGPTRNYSLMFNVSTGGAVRSSPAVGRDGTVFIGSDDAQLYAREWMGRLLKRASCA